MSVHVPPTNHLTSAQRVHQYHRLLDRYQKLLAHTSEPSFNATKGEAILKAMVTLARFLKAEADALWRIGINVYH